MFVVDLLKNQTLVFLNLPVEDQHNWKVGSAVILICKVESERQGQVTFVPFTHKSKPNIFSPGCLHPG